jgi:sulfatase modifying factor 1
MKRVLHISMCVLFLSSIASAELVQGISIDFVTIGNPGNPGDTRIDYPYSYPNSAVPYGCGSVDYTYRIGKYEVTNAQWYDFVTAAGAPTGNDSDAYDQSAYFTGGNVPANNVSWYEAAQFCNYLTSGDKSQGAYQFSGDNANPGGFEGIDRDSAVSTYGIIYVLPTEDEWYKAAYYTGNGYSTYANGTDTAPIKGDDTNHDNAIGHPWNVGDGTMEQNGTFDMMGNVFEWNASLITRSSRGVRGGSYTDASHTGWYIGSSRQGESNPYNEFRDVGFRVASVPEPCSLLLLSLGGLMLMRRRRVR